MDFRSLVPFLKGRSTEGKDVFLNLHRDVNHLFNEMFKNYDLTSPVNLSDSILTPKTDIKEFDKHYEITAELAGVQDKDVDVSVTDNTLTIRAEKKFEKKEDTKDYHLMERSYGAFARSLILPSEVDGNNIQANFKNGVLTLTVPKLPVSSEKIKKIAIKTT